MLAGIENFLERRLKLKKKPRGRSPDRPCATYWTSASPVGQSRDGASPQTFARFKAIVWELPRRTRGRSLAQIAKELSVYLKGWRGYFGSAKCRRCCVCLMRGSGGGCAPSPVNNGSAGALVQSCDAAASAGTWQCKLLAAHMARGGSQTVLQTPLPCQTFSSVRLAWLPSRHRSLHNPANRRIRALMSGAVGGGRRATPPISIGCASPLNVVLLPRGGGHVRLAHFRADDRGAPSQALIHLLQSGPSGCEYAITLIQPLANAAVTHLGSLCRQLGMLYSLQ